MDSNNKTEHEHAASMAEQTVVYGYNDCTQDPETVLSITHTKSTTKRYKGVWRKNGRWVARIRDHVTNSRVFLGKFCTHKDALTAYFAKKSELESRSKVSNVSNSAMIDRHGFLLGGFSRLDDDLKICE